MNVYLCNGPLHATTLQVSDFAVQVEVLGICEIVSKDHVERTFGTVANRYNLSADFQVLDDGDYRVAYWEGTVERYMEESKG